jgi:hypothetical protein
LIPALPTSYEKKKNLKKFEKKPMMQNSHEKQEHEDNQCRDNQVETPTTMT